MKFLGKLRQRARVRKTWKLRHLFQIGRDHLRERSGDVSVGGRVGLQDRRGIVRCEHVPGVGIEILSDGEAISLLESADSAAEIAAIQAIDLARREMCPIQQGFGFCDQRRTLIVCAVWGGVVYRSGGDRGYRWRGTR